MVEKGWNLFGSRDDVAHALGFGRVLEHQRIEQCIADQLDVDRGVVPVTPDGIETEQRQLDLAHHDVVIGAIFGREFLAARGGAQASADGLVELLLSSERRGAEIIQLPVEIYALVLVIPGRRRGNR